MIKTSKITITKQKGKWKGTLSITEEDETNGSSNTNNSFIYVDHFQELMVEMGNKNWIDKLNKNNEQ